MINFEDNSTRVAVIHRFQGQKVKVTRPTKAEMEIVSYLPNEKAYELQTWYTNRWLGGLLVDRRTSVSQIRGSIPCQVAAV